VYNSCIFLVFALILLIGCKQSLVEEIKGLPLKNNCAYIVLKGSKGKLFKNISRFNLIHNKSSHVAIGLVDSNSILLHHITTSKNSNGNNYYVETIDSFIANDSNVVFFAIYQLNLNKIELETLKSNIGNNRVFEYDYEFIDSNNKYYCSEYAVDMIQKCSDRFKFNKRKFKVDDFIGFMTEDNILNIYPIDFITESKNVELIFRSEH
jgi:hypothetical protein